MTFLRSYGRAIALTAVGTALLIIILKTALAGPDTVPNQADRIHAERVLPAPTGETDVRLPEPPSGRVAGLGVVEPAAPESRLAPAVSGRIVAIHVREGDHVEAGTLLAELENAAEKAALAATEADVDLARADLARARRGARPEDRDALGAEARAADVQATTAADRLVRVEAAASGGGISADELDRARREAEGTQLTADRAAALERAGGRGRAEDVLGAVARLSSAIARRDQAAAAVAERSVVAPIAGEVLQLPYRVGEYISLMGQNVEPVVVLGDTRTLRARIDVDERDVGRVALGASAWVVADAWPDRRFEAEVVEIGRRMGRKNVRSDEPAERIDVKILEVVLALRDTETLIPGQRVTGYIAERPLRSGQPAR